MMVKKIKRKNNHLDFSTIENLELSIQFSLDGFSFCLSNTDLDEFVSFHKYEFNEYSKNPELLLNNIMQIFIEEEDLRLNYSKINVIHENNLVSFVPKVLFDESQLKNYLSFNIKTYESDFLVYDGLVNQEMNAVFIPYINVNNFLIDQYGSFTYKHYSSILVENLLNFFESKEGTSFFVNVTALHFEIIVSKNKKLIFYNSFEHHTKEDFIYYILFTIEQLSLNVETLKLQFLGTINIESELYQIAYKYIRNISFIENNFKHLNNIVDAKLIRENFSLFHF